MNPNHFEKKTVRVFENKVQSVSIPILHKALSHCVDLKKTIKTKNIPQNGINECAIEQMAAYSATANRWERDALKATGDAKFDAVMRLSRHHSKPLIHLRHFLLKKFSESELDRDGGHLARLVDGKLDEFTSEFQELLNDEGWLNHMLDAVDAACQFSSKDRTSLKELASCHLRMLASSFSRRIGEVVNSTSVRILLLAKSPQQVDCCDRRRVARELLDVGPHDDVEPGLGNFIKYWNTDLERAQCTGTCPEELYILVKVARRKWRCSVAPNEGLHSLMKCIGERARNCEHELYNARTCIKAYLNKTDQFTHAYTGNARQVRTLAAIGSALIDTCAEVGNTAEEAKTIIAEVCKDRFRVRPLENIAAILARAAIKGDAALGAKLELVWKASVKGAVDTWSPLLLQLKSANGRITKESYLTCEHFRHRSWVSCATVNKAIGVVSIEPKFNVVRVQDVLASNFSDIKANKLVVVTTRVRMDSYTKGVLVGKAQRLRVTVGRKTPVKPMPSKVGEHSKEGEVIKPGLEQDVMAKASELLQSLAAEGKGHNEDVCAGVGIDDLAEIEMPAGDGHEYEEGVDDLVGEGVKEQQDRLQDAETQVINAALASDLVPEEMVTETAAAIVVEDEFKSLPDAQRDAVLNVAGIMGVAMPRCAADFTERIPELREKWSRNSMRGINVLRARATAMTRAVGELGELSLIQPSPASKSVYIRWSVAEYRRGRTVDIADDGTSVRALVCVGSKKYDMDYSKACIIHPAVGTHMRKIKEIGGGGDIEASQDRHSGILANYIL